MPIPDFQSLMLPLLILISDGQDHTHSYSIDALAIEFGLTEEELRERLPSGKQSKFDNRVGWARTHLKKAGLLESTGWGQYRITQRGIDVLNSRPNKINLRFLNQFPEFREFRSKSTSSQPEAIEIEERYNQTIEEVLEASYQSLRQELAQELLQRVKSFPPRFFEQLVIDLLVAMGYGGSQKDAGKAIGQSHDGGIDGIINEDKLGLDVVYIQAKRWENTVGRPVVQAFAGSLEGQRARKGILITTSQFSIEAREYVRMIEKKIVLIDGEQLTQLMIDYGVGVAEKATYTVKKIDEDYFSGE